MYHLKNYWEACFNKNTNQIWKVGALTEGKPGSFWRHENFTVCLELHQKHGYRYLACKSTIMMVMNFAKALICSTDVAAKCQRGETKAAGLTWDFAWRGCSSANVWEQVVDIGHRLRLHRALLLRRGLQPHTVKHNREERRRRVWWRWETDPNTEMEELPRENHSEIGELRFV